MFGTRFFGNAYFGGHYWGHQGSNQIPLDFVWTIGYPTSKWAVTGPTAKWTVGYPQE